MCAGVKLRVCGGAYCAQCVGACVGAASGAECRLHSPDGACRLHSPDGVCGQQAPSVSPTQLRACTPCWRRRGGESGDVHVRSSYRTACTCEAAVEGRARAGRWGASWRSCCSRSRSCAAATSRSVPRPHIRRPALGPEPVRASCAYPRRGPGGSSGPESAEQGLCRRGVAAGTVSRRGRNLSE